MTNPIRYTSTDYDSVMADINNDPLLKDRPEWWKRIWSGVRDVIGVQVNATANQSFLRTAFTRQAVADLCNLIDYQLATFSTSSGYIIFHIDAATTLPVTFTASEIKAASQGTITRSSKQFEARASVTVTDINESFTANATTNRLTVARAYTTGEKVRLTTTVTLPAPLAINTDYYVIYYSATEIYLADSLLHAFNGTNIDLTDTGTGAHRAYLKSFQAECYQQETIADTVQIGTSDGATAWQIFYLPDQYVLSDTLVITINGDAWTAVTTMVNSISTDKHYKIINLDNGMKAIMTGDGTYGKIPGNFPVYADYAIGGTSSSNISTLNSISVYAGNNTSIVSTTNAVTLTGGADEEALATAKVVAPMLLKARSRDITVDDGTYLAQNYAGVLKVKVNKNVYGVLSQQVVIVPAGGGTPSSGLKTAVASYLTDLTILGSILTVCTDPVYITVAVTATVKILSGQIWSTVQGYVILALRLLFSEVSQEVIDAYNGGGVADAITYINTKWSTSFTAVDNTPIIRILDNLTVADFGVDFQASDVEGFIDSFVTGVDYIVISSPSFPITIDDDEITTEGTMTITQI